MRLNRLLALVAFTILLPAGSACGQQLDDLEPLSDAELSEQRGGFLSVDGILFDFAARILTTVDGQALLETHLVWTPDGVQAVDSIGATSPIPELGGHGLQLVDPTGTLLVGHRLLNGDLQGFIVNTGSDRVVRQDIDIVLTLPGFDAIQRDILGGRLSSALGFDIASGLNF